MNALGINQGTSGNLSVRVPGGLLVTPTGMPYDEVRPADIAFLHPGQPAMVKITAYDFSIYGGLDAVVEDISADTITDEHGESYYRVRVRTHDNALYKAGEPLPIIPGMTTQVDILTGKKTVLDYLLKPILRAKERALRER